MGVRHRVNVWFIASPAAVLVMGMLLVAADLPGQIQPEAAAVLERVAQKYGSISAYRMETAATMDAASSMKSMVIRLAFQSPGKYRLETVADLRAPAPDGSTSVIALMVFDGKTWWGYQPVRNVYGKGDASPLDADTFGIGPFRDPLVAFQKQNGKLLRLLPEEVCADERGESLCFVVDLRYGHGSGRMWIDRSTYLVKKWEHLGSVYVVTKMEVNPSLPDSTFSFVPPSGATAANEIQ